MKIVPPLGQMLEKNAQAVGTEKIRVTSGYRPCAVVKSKRGQSPSFHATGRAVDSNLGAGTSRCPAYKATAENVNGKKFLPCNHGKAPHLHMDVGSPPCQNCDGSISSSRTSAAIEVPREKVAARRGSSPREPRYNNRAGQAHPLQGYPNWAQNAFYGNH